MNIVHIVYNQKYNVLFSLLNSFFTSCGIWVVPESVDKYHSRGIQYADPTIFMIDGIDEYVIPYSDVSQNFYVYLPMDINYFAARPNICYYDEATGFTNMYDICERIIKYFDSFRSPDKCGKLLEAYHKFKDLKLWMISWAVEEWLFEEKTANYIIDLEIPDKETSGNVYLQSMQIYIKYLQLSIQQPNISNILDFEAHVFSHPFLKRSYLSYYICAKLQSRMDYNCHVQYLYLDIIPEMFETTSVLMNKALACLCAVDEKWAKNKNEIKYLKRAATFDPYHDDLLAIIRYMVKREAKEGISDETMINVLAFDIDQLSKTIENLSYYDEISLRGWKSLRSLICGRVENDVKNWKEAILKNFKPSYPDISRLMKYFEDDEVGKEIKQCAFSTLDQIQKDLSSIH